ncbi:hypothetical protein IP91_04623 [Pseudoduganella lurida]|uniref:Lipoprotein n=1 Tax=Pseudoduganella lurida TaxID=1036180 RepID=A0A562QY80_9BURK|nr:hypothetical protein [Pseudoduganella lurida]TWI61543.1 hypothetical protein IP91_04623 [Pseudoduganella lurida]
MKSMYARAGAGALCAALLAGCGGDDNGSLLLTVTVYGLIKPGLVLTNNNGEQDLSVPAGSDPSPSGTGQSVYFPNLIAQDANFNVTVKSQPTATTCTPVEGSNTGKANYYNAQRVVVQCVTNSYKLGGTISGLTQDQVTLTNGSVTVTVRPETGSTFTFPGTVYDGLNYGVTVLTQPSGLTCSVQNGTGTMPSGDMLNVVVTCAPKSA